MFILTIFIQGGCFGDLSYSHSFDFLPSALCLYWSVSIWMAFLLKSGLRFEPVRLLCKIPKNKPIDAGSMMKSAASKDFSLTSVKQGELMTVGTTFPTKPTDIFGRGSCEPPLTSSNRGESKCKNERLADSFPLSVCYFSIPRYSHPSLQTRRKSGRLIALRNWRRVLRRKTRRCGEKPESKALSKPTNTILPKSRESPETKSPIKDLKLYGQTHVAELV